MDRPSDSLPHPPRTHGRGESLAALADAYTPTLVRALTGLLIAALCAWMLAGAVAVLVALGRLASRPWAEIAEQVVIDALIMLALLEVIRTLQAYLALGRVRVTFILDTALVVLISELMGLWFREYAPEKVLLAIGVIFALVALRIVTAKFSPAPLRWQRRRPGLSR